MLHWSSNLANKWSFLLGTLHYPIAWQLDDQVAQLHGPHTIVLTLPSTILDLPPTDEHSRIPPPSRNAPPLLVKIVGEKEGVSLVAFSDIQWGNTHKGGG